MRNIRNAARAIIYASDERLLLLAKHDPGMFRDVAAALLSAQDTQHYTAMLREREKHNDQ